MPEATRKLAAIVFTDIAGFTALSAEDEEKALSLIDKQRELLQPIVLKHNGKWLKEMGDGLLLTFSSTKQAVNCAIEIQKTSKLVEGLNIRIGIHQGDILEKDGDVFGDDVNIASRIEPFSAIGGIAISGKINEDISGSPELTTNFIGRPKLKGVSQDVKVYCITSHGLPETKLAEVSAKLEKNSKMWVKFGIPVLMIIAFLVYIAIPSEGNEVPSVGILYMENIGSEEDEFWARGITEDVIIEVASAGLIRVTPMKKILEVVKSDLQFEQIAERLGVKFLLTSSIHKKEDKFDLRTQLIEANTGKNIFAQKWSEPIINVGIIVEKLSEVIINELGINITTKIKKDYIPDPVAYEYYLRAKSYHHTKNQEELNLKRSLLLKAIEIDEKVVAAQRMLGNMYDSSGEYHKAVDILKDALAIAEKYGWEKDTGWTYQSLGTAYLGMGDQKKAVKYGNKAINIFRRIGNKEDLYGVLYTLGKIYKTTDYEQAIAYYQEALNISQLLEKRDRYSSDFYEIGDTYQFAEKSDSALKYLNYAMEWAQKTETKHTAKISVSFGDVYIANGEIDIAFEHYNTALESNPNHWLAINRKAFLYMGKSEYKMALKYFDQNLKLSRQSRDSDDESFVLSEIAYIFSIIGDLDSSLFYYQSAVNIKKVLNDQRGLAWDYYFIGEIYMNQKNTEKAIEYFRFCIATETLSASVLFKGIAYHLIGEISYKRGNYLEASENFRSATKMWDEVEDIKRKIRSLSWLANTEAKLNDLYMAEISANETIELLKTNESHQDNFIVIHWNLSQAFSGLKDQEKSNKHLELAYREIQSQIKNKSETEIENFLNEESEHREVWIVWNELNKN